MFENVTKKIEAGLRGFNDSRSADMSSHSGDFHESNDWLLSVLLEFRMFIR